jgi:sporulation protein YlmC with PRC-barrel domain
MLNFLQKGKDSFLVSAAKSFFNQQFSRYGQLQELELDTTSKKIRALLLPNGEDRTIEIKLADYQIERAKDGTFFVPGKVEVDRPWLQALFNDFGAGQRFPVPASIAAFV